MDRFREEYSRAVEVLPEFHMDAGQIQDELHHRRMRKKRRDRLVARGCTAAAALVLVCGAGTAAAKNYGGGIIVVRESGYTVTGTAAEEEGGNEGAFARSMDGNEDFGIEAYPEEECDISVVESGGAEEREYKSLTEFSEDPAAAKIPDIAFLQTELGEAGVSVLEDETMLIVRVTADGSFFSLSQYDYREAVGYGSATAYSGQTANERSYTNYQGLSYVVFDTISEGGQVEATHAVISVEGRELSMDFYGFEEESVDRVLSNLDLAVYFSD